MPGYRLRRNFDDPRERGQIANGADAFRIVSHIRSEVRRSPKRARQRLALLRNRLLIEALLVQRAVEVIACVRVPTPITARNEDMFDQAPDGFGARWWGL